MMPIEGMSTGAVLPLNSGLSSSAQLVDLAARPGRAGCRACRRCRLSGSRSRSRSGRRGTPSRPAPSTYCTSNGRMPWLRDLPAVRVLALGEDRDDLSQRLILVRSIGCMTPRGTVYIRKQILDVGDVERLGLGDHAVEQRGVVGGLHLDLEAEVLARLARDVDDRRVGAADMEQGHVLDVLRPDGRKAGDRTGAGGEAGGRGGALQHGAAVQALGSWRRPGGSARRALSDVLCHVSLPVIARLPARPRGRGAPLSIGAILADPPGAPQVGERSRRRSEQDLPRRRSHAGLAREPGRLRRRGGAARESG